MTDILVSFRPGTRLLADGEGPVRLGVGPAIIGLGAPGAGAVEALSRLAGPGATEDGLANLVARDDGEDAMLSFRLLLRRIDNAGLLSRTVRTGSEAEEPGRALATLEPFGLRAVTPGREPRPSDRVSLSRFSLLRKDDGRLVVETPRSTLRVALHDARLTGLAALLASPTTVAEAAEDASTLGVAADEALAVLTLLGRAGVLAFHDTAQGEPEEDEERRLVQWHPVDLLFHQRSRLGLRVLPYGGTYHLADRFEPLPAERSPSPLDVTFEPVDLAEVARRDPGLTEVIEARRSVRHHDDTRPLTAGQLGELLYRTVRTRRIFHDSYEDVLDRPVPAGGSIHALGLYVAAWRCADIDPGLYRYQADGHGLVRVSNDVPGVHQLLSAVPLVPGGDALPQVLLVASARFGRVMWKYESMAYALVLKDLGVLYQSVYLVATAMGLAPCALGGGDSAAFARLTGLDPYEEASVGEFALGSMPTDPA